MPASSGRLDDIDRLDFSRQQQEWWWEKENRRSLRSRLDEAEQRADPAAVHSSTGPHQQKDGGKGWHEERPGPGGEWQTGATGDTSWRSGTGCLPDTG